MILVKERLHVAKRGAKLDLPEQSSLMLSQPLLLEAITKTISESNDLMYKLDVLVESMGMTAELADTINAIRDFQQKADKRLDFLATEEI